MPLPTNRELREMLECASPYPWRKEWGLIISSDRERDILLAVLSGEYGNAYPRKEDTGLLLIAPQLAEEVIRLREEIDRLKWHCRDSEQVADAETRLADTEREKAWQEGRAEAYYDTYLQITQGQHKEHE